MRSNLMPWDHVGYRQNSKIFCIQCVPDDCIVEGDETDAEPNAEIIYAAGAGNLICNRCGRYLEDV